MRLKCVWTLNESPIGFEGQVFSKAYVVALPGTFVFVSFICLSSVEVEVSLMTTSIALSVVNLSNVPSSIFLSICALKSLYAVPPCLLSLFIKDFVLPIASLTLECSGAKT